MSLPVRAGAGAEVVPRSKLELAEPVVSLSRLQARELSWLWPGRLADGTLAMFDGDPGRGSRW
jgi:hypothetical protein